MKIAVVGGDERAKHAAWPKGYEIATYQSSRHGGTGERRRLQSAISAGKIDGVVILARWTGHSEDSIPGGVPRVIWPRGVNELAKQIPTLFPLPPGATLPQTETPIEPMVEASMMVETSMTETVPEVTMIKETEPVPVITTAATVHVPEPISVTPMEPPLVQVPEQEAEPKPQEEDMDMETNQKNLLDRILELARAEPDHIFTVQEFAEKLGGKTNQGRRNTVVDRLTRLAQQGFVDHIAKNAYRLTQELLTPEQPIAESSPLNNEDLEDSTWISAIKVREITDYSQSRIRQLVRVGAIHKQGASVGTKYLRADCEALAHRGGRRILPKKTAPKPSPVVVSEPVTTAAAVATVSETTEKLVHLAHIVKTLHSAVDLGVLSPTGALDTFLRLANQEKITHDANSVWSLLVEVATQING